MLYGYGILNNHVPTLKATVMKIGAAISTLLTSLYAVYKAESNANDSLGNYNGTASGGLTYTSGKSGNCFVANGSNAEITFSDVFKFSDSSTNAFSFSFWCNFSENGVVPQSIFSNFWQTSVYYGYMIWYYNNVVTFSRYNGTTTPIVISSGTLTTSTWYNITITRKDGSTKMYINGSLVASDTSTTSIVYTTTHYPRMLSRKTDAGAPNWFLASGSKVDEVNIWNKELTSTEVTELYNAGTGKFYPY